MRVGAACTVDNCLLEESSESSSKVFKGSTLCLPRRSVVALHTEGSSLQMKLLSPILKEAQPVSAKEALKNRVNFDRCLSFIGHQIDLIFKGFVVTLRLETLRLSGAVKMMSVL